MCPTYKNVSSLKATVEGNVVEPGQTISTLNYHDENEVGLLKVDDKPCFSPTLFSEVIQEDKEVKMPFVDSNGSKITKFALHFFVEKGEVEVFYNCLENLPSLKLYEDARWNNRYTDRKIDKIFIKGITKRFILWLQIEKIY